MLRRLGLSTSQSLDNSGATTTRLGQGRPGLNDAPTREPWPCVVATRDHSRARLIQWGDQAL